MIIAGEFILSHSDPEGVYKGRSRQKDYAYIEYACS